MSDKLKEQELLEFSDRFYYLWREWMQKKTTMPNMLKLAGEAHQQIRKRIQAYAEHQELTANYIDIVIDLYDQLERKKPKVTEEWIKEKARVVYICCRTKTLVDTRDFIRSLVEEIQGRKDEKESQQYVDDVQRRRWGVEEEGK